MRKVLRLAQREYLAAVKTKGFIIGLVLAPILMGGSFLAMAFMRGHVDTTDKRVAVVDRSGRVAAAVVAAAKNRNEKEIHQEKTGKKIKPAYLIQVVEPRRQDPEVQRLELSDQVRGGQLHAFVDIGAAAVHPQKDDPNSRIDYYAKNPALDDVRSWLAWPVNEQLRRERMTAAGLEPDKVKGIFDWQAVGSMGLVSRDTKTGEVTKAQHRNEAEAVLVPMLTQILLFMLMMMGAAPLLQAVMEEKTQRIAEVLLGSVTPSELMLGKLIGGVAVAVTGSVVYVAGTILTLSGLALGSLVPYRVLPWFIVFMLLAVFMYGAMMAALGSACSDSKDAQNLQLPAMLPLIASMMLMGPMLKEPHSPLGVALSLFPPFTPTLLLLRLSTPEGVAWWQPWAGLIGVVACTVLSVWAAGRIFRVGILMQGKPPRFAEILRWALRG
jgi:ABC-2 type transport system permease protein